MSTLPTRGQRPSRPLSNVELAESLCQVSVQLREAKRLHMLAYGVLIPHIFMADVLKRIGACLGATSTPTAERTEVQDIMDVLERGMVDGDRETRNVITLSFTRDSELELFFDKLIPLLGPATRAQLGGK